MAFGAARPGVNAEDGIEVVIGAVQQTGDFHVYEQQAQAGDFRRDFLKGGRVVFFLGDGVKRQQILYLAQQRGVARHTFFQRGDFLHQGRAFFGAGPVGRVFAQITQIGKSFLGARQVKDTLRVPEAFFSWRSVRPKVLPLVLSPWFSPFVLRRNGAQGEAL